MAKKTKKVECDICKKIIWNDKFYIEEAFLKKKEEEEEAYHIKMVPIAVCVNCKEVQEEERVSGKDR